MKTTKNIARLAVTAGLTAVLSFGGVMAPVTMAFAAGSTTVTFDCGGYEGSTAYKGIQIFKANVTTANGTTTVCNIDWASSEVETAVVAAIQEIESTYTSTNAQDAADWLNEHNKDANRTDSDTKVNNGHVLSVIASKLENTGTWSKTSAGSPSLTGLDAGYWLFLTDATVKPSGKSTDAFTSPVYSVIDGTNTTVTITPKKSVPTVEKKILDDAAAAGADIKTSNQWKDIADSQIGQEVNYRLTGTIASNYATYDSYTYNFTDTLSKGLSYVDGQTQVFAVNKDSNNIDQYTDITENFTVQSTTNGDGITTLTIKANEGEHGKYLKEISEVDASTRIVVFYKAVLNGSAVIGNATVNTQKGGNPNTVKLEYSNNPYDEGTGVTIEDTVADFAFKLNLNKVDQGTEKGLGDAVFTIQSADENTQGQYIASKDDATANVVAGQLVENVDSNNLPDYVKFTSSNASGEEGSIRVKGLDAGSYTVTEIKTPDDTKYTKAKPFTFTITPTYDDATMRVTELTAAVSGQDVRRSDIAFGVLDGSAGDNKLNGTDSAAVNAATGEVTINVGNTKQINLPLTGLNGVTFTWIAGGAVLCIGVAHLIRSRKRDEGSEE